MIRVDDQGQVVFKDTSDASKTACGLVLVSLVLGTRLDLLSCRR